MVWYKAEYGLYKRRNEYCMCCVICSFKVRDVFKRYGGS